MPLSSFPQRLSDAAWAKEWPLVPTLGEGRPVAQATLPAALGWAWHSATAVMAAIDGSAQPVQLDLAHRLLDELESWTARNRALLSWPPTVDAFARALVASARQADASVVAVIVAYPGYCRQVLEQARQSDPELPGLDALFPPPSPARPPLRPTPARRDSPPPSAAAKAADPAPEFLGEWLARARAEAQPALVRHHLDERIKQAVATHGKGGWNWFFDVLMPALTQLEPEDLRFLTQAWPPQSRFTPPNPVAWADSTRWWGIMRDAGAERRELLCDGGLSTLVDLSQASATTRLAMLTKMLPFVAKKPAAFRQRLLLWQSLGGNLDAQVEPQAVEGVTAASAREWIAQQDNPQWNEILLSIPSHPSASRFHRGPG